MQLNGIAIFFFKFTVGISLHTSYGSAPCSTNYYMQQWETDKRNMGWKDMVKIILPALLEDSHMKQCDYQKLSNQCQVF